MRTYLEDQSSRDLAAVLYWHTRDMVGLFNRAGKIGGTFVLTHSGVSLHEALIMAHTILTLQMHNFER